MSVIENAVERVTGSEKVVHLAWLLVLLLVETGHVVAGGGTGSSGP
ncbi:hypothetical protein [Halorussus lipolyticus]|nr:hypothetical protein [Halorussus sp. DT80]